MTDYFPDDTKKVGMPPESMVYVGEEASPTVIKKVSFNEKNISEEIIENLDNIAKFDKKNNVTWISVTGLKDSKKIIDLCSTLKLHDLTTEDILNTNQRPKIEEFENYLFVVMNHITYKDKDLVLEQISFVLGKNFIASFSEEESFQNIRDRIKFLHGLIRRKNNDYFLYALMDLIIDHYFLVLEDLSEEMEVLDDETMFNPSKETLNNVHELKRNLLLLRKKIWPLRYIITSLYKTKSGLIDDSVDFYLRDLYDHAIRVLDTIETLRDMDSGILDVYMSNLSNKANETMKVLTIIATIFIPLTFIAGVYGMNFDYMPELHWVYGYPLVLGVMFFISLLMLVYFKKRDWI
jgi:magnesium transporter